MFLVLLSSDTAETWMISEASESFTGAWELVQCYPSVATRSVTRCLVTLDLHTHNGCAPDLVHSHRAEVKTVLTYFLGQLLTGERREGRGSAGHKPLVPAPPGRDVSGAQLPVSVSQLCAMALFRAARSQDKISHPFFDKTWQQHMPHLLNHGPLCWQQIASSPLTNRSRLEGALYLAMFLPDILSQYTSSLPPLLPRSLPLSKSCHTARH